jgi:hypothetical protein
MTRKVGNIWVMIDADHTMNETGDVTVVIHVMGPQFGHIKRMESKVPKQKVIDLAFPDGIPKIGDEV